MNQQMNKFIERLCSDKFDSGEAICDLTGHQPMEVELPEPWASRLDEQFSNEADDLINKKINE